MCSTRAATATLAVGEDLVTQSCRNQGPADEVALVGKYVQPQRRLPLGGRGPASRLASIGMTSLDLRLDLAEQLRNRRARSLLHGMDAVVVPAALRGTGRGRQVQHPLGAASKQVPFLGALPGMQCAVIAWCPHEASSQWRQQRRSFDADSPDPKLSTCLPSSRTWIDLGGTMRLRRLPCRLSPGSCLPPLWRGRSTERHRHSLRIQ